jgi:hypothetical protein
VLVLVEELVDDEVDVDELVELELLELDEDVEELVEVEEDVDVEELVLEEVLDEVLVEVLDDVELLDEDEEVLDDVDDELDDVELEVLDDVELVLDVDELVLLDVLLLVDEDDVLDDVEVEVVVLGGGGRPMTGIRAARHLADVPGTVSAIVVHNPVVLLSQLTTVPTSTMPSLLVSTQRIVRLSMFRSVLTFCSMSPQKSADVSPW